MTNKFLNDFLATIPKEFEYTVAVGPWGEKDTDRTKVVKVALGEDESLLVWLVDRDIWPGMKELRTISWFNYSNIGQHGLPEHKGFVSFAELYSSAQTCDFCKESVGAENLSRVAFANAACETCLPAAKAKLETPGWCN